MHPVASRARRNPRFSNGVPELLILKLLSRGEMYGYQIAKAIRSTTQDALAFGEGCIYPMLRSLERQRLVKSRRERVEGRMRLYYALSASGRARLAAMTADWNRVARGVGLVLDGGSSV